MLKKWHIFSFVLSFVLLGVIQQHHNPKANQEIVVQFSDLENSESDSEKSLSKITRALELIGADGIAINSNKKGFYNIVYYSEKTVKTVKQKLSEYVKVGFKNSSNKKQKHSEYDYNLDVFKIRKDDTTPWDFEGQEVYTLSLKSDRSFNPGVLKLLFKTQEDKIGLNFKVVYNAAKSAVFTLDNVSFNVPEVRAGPLA